MTKVSDKLTPYKEPPQPENTSRRVDVRLWREHYIYNAAEADAFSHLIQLFENNMDKELKDWLRKAIKIRREQAEKADKYHRELSMKLWESTNV